jgi:hypothetical protein
MMCEREHPISRKSPRLATGVNFSPIPGPVGRARFDDCQCSATLRSAPRRCRGLSLIFVTTLQVANGKPNASQGDSDYLDRSRGGHPCVSSDLDFRQPARVGAWRRKLRSSCFSQAAQTKRPRPIYSRSEGLLLRLASGKMVRQRLPINKTVAAVGPPGAHLSLSLRPYCRPSVRVRARLAGRDAIRRDRDRSDGRRGVGGV